MKPVIDKGNPCNNVGIHFNSQTIFTSMTSFYLHNLLLFGGKLKYRSFNRPGSC